ncbi:class I glutamine amidotransferase-like protein [Podospora fimiseda]|uniref:Class I glutamine amidotransferase-like protein n=1 Tax=Podospora fimiseda TaxID=252190 RepID=A0AAN7BG91_9PEZI|nr:class I glutamine amidotransferase-like protein [Podospora fimiseda]
MSQPFNLSKPNRPIHIGIILMAGETEILDVAPIDMIHGLTKQFIDPIPDALVDPELKSQALEKVHFHWISEAGSSVPSRLTGGISLVPTDNFATCPGLDIVLIGAHNIGYNPSEGELAFTRKVFDECTAFITVCAGVEVPLRAGLLQGKTATGPKEFLPMLRGASPGTNWVEKRWVRDGKLWTSGALLNGMDLIRAFGEEVWGSGKEGNGLVGRMLDMGSFPVRNVDYADVDGNLQE